MRILPAVAVLAAVLSITPANAVTVVGATSIRITNALNDYLQVAEVRATDFSGTVVSAASNGATASANDVYASFSSADKAIDGNIGGNYYSDTIYHGQNPGSSTLTIDFSAATLASLTIYGRSDCCQERDVYNVSIFGAGNTLLYSGRVSAVAGPGTVTFDAPSAVPEPATWGLLVAGFSMTGFAMRRRKIALTA